MSFLPSLHVSRPKEILLYNVFPSSTRALWLSSDIITGKARQMFIFFLLIATDRARRCYPSRNCITISIPFSVCIFLTADLTHAFDFSNLKWFVFINGRDKISKNENAV